MGIIGKSILAEQEKWYNRCNFLSGFLSDGGRH